MSYAETKISTEKHKRYWWSIQYKGKYAHFWSCRQRDCVRRDESLTQEVFEESHATAEEAL